MRYTFTVEVEAERTEGKFATRDEIGDELMQAIESADPGSVEGEEGGQYEIVSWDVEEQPQVRGKAAKR